MAEALILDSEALYALANAPARGVLGDRARAILQIAHEKRALVRVPAPVHAEVCRGQPYDAAIDRLLPADSKDIQRLAASSRRLRVFAI